VVETPVIREILNADPGGLILEELPLLARIEITDEQLDQVLAASKITTTPFEDLRDLERLLLPIDFNLLGVDEVPRRQVELFSIASAE
jgi:hypothetical protein